MRWSKYFFVVITFLFLSCNKNTPTEPENILTDKLVINEFLALNDKNNADEYGEFDDWIELYNGTYEPINVGGMYISDSLTNKTKFQIPETDSIKTKILPKLFQDQYKFGRSISKQFTVP